MNLSHQRALLAADTLLELNRNQLILVRYKTLIAAWDLLKGPRVLALIVSKMRLYWNNLQAQELNQMMEALLLRSGLRLLLRVQYRIMKMRKDRELTSLQRKKNQKRQRKLTMTLSMNLML